MKITLDIQRADMPPSESGQYICFFDSGCIMNVSYSAELKGFNLNPLSEDPRISEIFPAYWSAVPQIKNPPEDDQSNGGKL